MLPIDQSSLGVLALLFAAPLAFAEPVSTGPAILLRTGFVFTEGPASDADGNLYFTDSPTNRIYRLTTDGRLDVFVEPSRRANGLMVWRDRLFACEADGSLVQYRLGDPDSRTVLSDGFDGRRFNACNDLVVDGAGGVYFTDPEYSAPKPLPQKVRGVYYRNPEGRVLRVVEELPNPNGVLLSPDESILYVIPSSQAEVLAYPVHAPGVLGSPRAFAPLAQPPGRADSGGDGGAVDEDGNLYVASELGVQVFSPDGERIEIVATPEVPANATFLGPQRRTLIVAARTSLYRVETNRRGHAYGGP